MGCLTSNSTLIYQSFWEDVLRLSLSGVEWVRPGLITRRGSKILSLSKNNYGECNRTTVDEPQQLIVSLIALVSDWPILLT